MLLVASACHWHRGAARFAGEGEFQWYPQGARDTRFIHWEPCSLHWKLIRNTIRKSSSKIYQILSISPYLNYKKVQGDVGWYHKQVQKGTGLHLRERTVQGILMTCRNRYQSILLLPVKMWTWRASSVSYAQCSWGCHRGVEVAEGIPSCALSQRGWQI